MSDSTTARESGHDHPSAADYVRIALVLAVVTAMEVALYYVEVGPLFLPSLIVMMIVKFALVVLWFMHLRFDKRIFANLFVTGLAIALFVFSIAIVTTIFAPGTP